MEADLYKSANMQDLTSAITSMPPIERQNIVSLLSSGNSKGAGAILEKALRAEIKIKAKARADTLLSNGTLSLTEIDEII